MNKLIIHYSIANKVMRDAFEAELKKLKGVHILEYPDEKMAVIAEGNFEQIVADLQGFVDNNLSPEPNHATWSYPVDIHSPYNHNRGGIFF